MKYECANLFYFRLILKIGGTEQFLYEIAKKYHKKDITVLYDRADMEQLARMRKLVRCIQRSPEDTYKAKRAFYNFNLDAIDQIEADEHIFVCHAIYQQIQHIPPLTNPKLTRWIGVSEYACREIKKYGKILGKDDIEPELCYNPLTLEKPKPILKIVSAGRLDDKVKGGGRTTQLIEAVEDYASKNGKKYMWFIFSNPEAKIKTSNPNLVFMESRIDVRHYIADSDWLVQLSDDMESFGYSINEALGYGVGVVHTPLSVIPELKVPKGATLQCDWDMTNVDEVAKKMFEPRTPFTYKPPKDSWNKFLINKPSHYTPPKPDTKIECIADYYDLELKRLVKAGSEPYLVTKERAEKLIRLRLCRLVR